MINLKPTVYNALLNYANLVSLLGGKRVYQLRAPNADEYPRITFFELDNSGQAWADDQEIASQIRIQVDIWHTANYDNIAAEVDTTMRSNGFQRTSVQDLFEQQTLVYHKAMRYATTAMEG